MWGELGFHPPCRGNSHFSWLVFWASIQLEFTYIKWRNKQNGCANVRSENTVMSNDNRWNNKIGLLLHNCNNNKMGPCITFSGIKVSIIDSYTLVYICLHSSSDPSTLVHTHLVTCPYSSIFVYICLWLVYTRVHSFTLAYISLWLVYICLHSSTLV